MDRRTFVTSALAASAATLPAAARAQIVAATVTTQEALFGALPRPRPGQWTRLVLGAGVAYQKQIGLGTETGSTGGDRYYVETQIGVPGGSCNPNTMKRVYLTRAHFGSLLSQDPVLANVANSGTTLTRWGDVDGGQSQAPADAKLRLLDLSYLYDDRPLRIVSMTAETLKLSGAERYAGSADSSRAPLARRPVTHIVAEFTGRHSSQRRLTHIEIWTSPEVPFGVAKYRALAVGLAPFDMQVYSHGTAFKPDLNMSLDTVRAITPDGTHIQTS